MVMMITTEMMKLMVMMMVKMMTVMTMLVMMMNMGRSLNWGLYLGPQCGTTPL